MQHGRKSRAARRKLDHPAWIVVNGSFGVSRCEMQDISTSGARLRVEKPDAVPKYFTLSFRQNDRGGRPCKVIWRSGSSVGVQFV
jgi:hypothetical protein